MRTNKFNLINDMQNTMKYKVLIIFTAVIIFSGCRKIFNVPDEKDYLSTKADYLTKVFEPTLGRTTLYTRIFNPDNSTAPMKFEMVNVRWGDGRDATDLLTKKQTWVWTGEYTGMETSIAEIEAKRKLEEHPIVELRPSGDLIVWASATSDVLKPRDSAEVFPQDLRYFDVKISNSGGSRIITGLSINPSIEVPYETDDSPGDINRYNGLPNTTTPNGNVLVRNHPNINGMIGEGTDKNLTANDGANGVVNTYIRRVSGGSGNTIRFKFLDNDSTIIDPNKFNETKWEFLVHGFNMEKTREYVKFDVAYPIPLARVPTRYTLGGVNNFVGGDIAHVEFSYSRIGFGGRREVGTLSENFRIFEKGDWEVVFHFTNVNPKFANE